MEARARTATAFDAFVKPATEAPRRRAVLVRHRPKCEGGRCILDQIGLSVEFVVSASNKPCGNGAACVSTRLGTWSEEREEREDTNAAVTPLHF